ncbi:MAG: adenosylcobinamide-phosphate synthase CbiB [Paracoccaceae bacterium]
MSHALLLALALLLDAIVGEPRWLWSRVPHPAVLFGKVIGWMDTRLNQGEGRKGKGVAAVALLVAGTAGLGWALSALPGGSLIEVLLAAILLAQKSLCQHVQAVGDALRLSLPDGQRAVARIVGRDVSALQADGVARAAVESAAENLSDGVIAPAFWFLLLGLPGILIYKVVNTADSMIGHMSDRYRDFGWAAARLDDALNVLPARLTAALILLASGRLDGRGKVLRDAPLHRSPNAGWPEAAMAVVLGISLAGPRSYGGVLKQFPWVLPEGRRDAGPDDIDASVQVLWKTWALLLALAAAMAVVHIWAH